MKELLTNWRFIIGVVFVIIAVFTAVKLLIGRKRSIRLPGEIVDFIWEKNYCYPLIRFTYEGEELSMQGANGANKPKGNVGDKVTVLYDPKDARYVNVAGNNTDLWVVGFLIIFGVIGILEAIIK